MKGTGKSKHGGMRRGAGRKPGALNKLSKQAIAAARTSGKLLPHEWLFAIMHNDSKVIGRGKRAFKPTWEQRIDAAKAAAPYYAPRLAAIVAKVNPGEGNPWVDLLRMVDGKSRGLPTGG